MREPGFDRVRGLALLLMFLDHGLGFVSSAWPDVAGWAALPRLTLTRISLPLFLLVGGLLLRGRNSSVSRLCAIFAAGVLVTPTVVFLPWMASVDVLLVIGLALLAWPAVRAWPVAAGMGCMVAAATFPGVWDGYHPAHVLGLLLIGSLASPVAVAAWGRRLPRWVGVVGRGPLRWYVGHLAALAVAWAFLRGLPLAV